MGVDPQLLQDLSPRAAQQTTRGRVMITAGWILRVLGIVLGSTGLVLLRASLNSDHVPSGFSQPLWWLTTVGALAVFYVGFLALAAGRGLVVRGKQHTMEILGSFAELAGTRYVLYLRPFSIDPELAALPADITGGSGAFGGGEAMLFISGLTHEEALIRRFRQFGRVIAIGRPGEQLPLPGAARAYLPLDDWQDTVSELIDGTHVAILAAGPGPGTVWEYTEALRLLPPSRLVLLIFCSSADYDRFREAASEEYARRSAAEPGAPDTGNWPPLPALPDYPSPFRPTRPRWQVIWNGGRKRLLWDFVLKGLIVFDSEWQPTFIRFDPTTVRTPSPLSLRRLVKREIKPLMDRLTALPARD